ncbi:MAG: adenylyltransferase/cytidyltransferase family protein [Phycisphaeraceae bacterium]|nr:adenylyltransferase/cytidyltransferase family protein [Phycisphaeraceae bacterium]
MSYPAPAPSNPSRRSPGHRPPAAVDKILSRERLMALRQELRRDGASLVHCHGCFDIVHPGHIRHLRQARSQGDALLVSITGDAEMRKGTGRPLIPEELRAEGLAALDCVDYVYIEQRPTAAELLDEVRPDVYVKGKEYELNSDPRFKAERNAVERHGGRVVFSSGDVVFSSTALIAAMEESTDPYHARLMQLLRDPMLDGARLTGLVSSFRGKRILVVGEPIIDTYVLCDTPSVAGESPVMTLRPVERRSYDGGSAVIARHLAAMGAAPVLVCAMPDDAPAAALRHRLQADGVEVRSVEAPGMLPEKQRFLVGAQKVMKVDLVDPLVLDARSQDELVGLAGESAAGCDGAILADFGLGLFSAGTHARLGASVRREVGVLCGDVSGGRSNLRLMREMDLLCPSESELRDAYRDFDESLPSVVWNLLHDTGSRHAIITMGADGLVAFDRLPGAESMAPVPEGDGFRSRLRGDHFPALCGHAIDPLGCGDALLATATLALASGAPLLGAAFLGAVAAAAQAQRLGNSVISASDLRHGIVRAHAAHLTCTPGQSPRPGPRLTVPLTA